ncbi:MAG: SufE family protein [Myxococcota bacterium]
MTIEELIQKFERMSDWQQRYRYLVEMGRKAPALDDTFKTDEHKVIGCMSQVWLVNTSEDPEHLVFEADSDAAIVKGLIAVVLVVYSGKSPKEIVQTDMDAIFSRLGLDKHLSPNRRNGFYSMVIRIKQLAVEHVMVHG